MIKSITNITPDINRCINILHKSGNNNIQEEVVSTTDKNITFRVSITVERLTLVTNKKSITQIIIEGIKELFK